MVVFILAVAVVVAEQWPTEIHFLLLRAIRIALFYPIPQIHILSVHALGM
jgi:hypothetical protein